MEYHKKIDKSVFEGYVTVPNKYIKYFIDPTQVPWGSHREITINFQQKSYHGSYTFMQQRNGSQGHQILQIRYGLELQKALQQEFIQTYLAIQSQKLLKQPNQKFQTNLTGGTQEVVIFKAIADDVIQLETFIKITTPYDLLFKRLVEANVFGWLSHENNQQMITKYTNWIDISELHQHADQNHVVYYLIDEQNRQLYIGSATRLGDRVKPNRKEIPGWNKFMYAIVHPQYHEDLKEIEYHSINSFARFFANHGHKSSLKLSDYTLVNKDYKYYRN